MGVADSVDAICPRCLHVVHQTFPFAEQKDLKGVRNSVSKVEDAGPFDGRPRALRGLVAVSPVRGQAVVAPRIDQFEAAASAIGPTAPAPAGLVCDLVDPEVDRVRDLLSK